MTIPAEGKVLRPSYDHQENLWILDRADSSKPRLRVRGQDGKVTDVTDHSAGTPRSAADGARRRPGAAGDAGETGHTYVQTATIQ